VSTTSAKFLSHNELESTRADTHGFIYINRRRRRVVSKNLNLFLGGFRLVQEFSQLFGVLPLTVRVVSHRVAQKVKREVRRLQKLEF